MMSNNTTENTVQNSPVQPIVSQQIPHLEELNKIREPINKAIKGLLPMIIELRRENTQLKAQLAEAQKTA
jgi:hypothetical protein